MPNVSDLDNSEVNTTVLKYEDFGAIGDGITDDSAAIRRTHDEANLRGLRVMGTAGKSYRIGIIESPIIVMTDTDWNGARIIFDDSVIPDDSAYRGIWVFHVTSSDTDNGHTVIPDTDLCIKKGQTNIGYPIGKACMLKLENSNKQVYLRYGLNANKGFPLSEMILVDSDGNVDPSTPIQYDYDTVTSIVTYSIDDTPIRVGNAKIETRVYQPRRYKPDYENYYCYYSRGVNISRSNTTLYGIDHTVVGEDMTVSIDRDGDGIIDMYGADKSYGVPYVGCFYFEYCYNSRIIDSVIQGHQAYSFFQGATHDSPGDKRNEMGSYVMNAHNAINLGIVNVRQRENPDTGELITNKTMYHGVMASVFCRNMLVDNCYFDRFDSHCGLHSATIRNSTIGFGIHVIGGGTLRIENTVRLTGLGFISLRNDYNSIFDGDIIVRGCTAVDLSDFIYGTWREFYNGLDTVMTRSIDIDGLEVHNDSFTLFHINDAARDALNSKINPLTVPERVTLRNVSVLTPDGARPLEPSVSCFDDAFASVKVNCKA